MLYEFGQFQFGGKINPLIKHNMKNQPIALSESERQEIAELEDIQDMFGAETADEMTELLRDIYMVKFNFISGSPGYVGEFFLVQTNHLTGDAPLQIIRSKDRKMMLVN
ncbi:MAG: hypothetical protein KGZ73_04910 [Rhizobiales bacterium]|nr:hypothetical protein [Hyphomicrobiales bacterium]